MGSDKNNIRDAIPAASLVMGTWLISQVTGDSFANSEAYTMLEAAGFSSLTAEAFKYAAGVSARMKRVTRTPGARAAVRFPRCTPPRPSPSGRYLPNPATMMSDGSGVRWAMAWPARQRIFGSTVTSIGSPIRWPERRWGLPPDASAPTADCNEHTTGICRCRPPLLAA